MSFDVGQIVNLVGQLGGNHQQAAQQLQGMGQVDLKQHARLLSQLGIAPQHLQDGGYRQVEGYTRQQPSFGQQGGQGYERRAVRASSRRLVRATSTSRSAA